MRLLSDDEHWQAMSDRGRARTSADYTWTAIAADWDALCRAALTVEPNVMERVGLHFSAGRTELAQRMLDREVPLISSHRLAWILGSRSASAPGRAAPRVPQDNIERTSFEIPALP